MRNDLSVKNKKFCDEFILSGDAAAAYIKAGYKVKNNKVAAVSASRLLIKPAIKNYIASRIKELDSTKIADMKEIMEYLTSVLRGEQTESVATAKGIYEDVEVSAKDRIKAAELIGKRYGAWTDKKEINGDLKIDIGVGDYDE